MYKNELKIETRLIELTPPNGIEKIILHWHMGKGWLVEYWSGPKRNTQRRIVTKCFTIGGIFTALLMVEKLTADEYLYPEELTEKEVINSVSRWSKKDYEIHEQRVTFQHPNTIIS